VTHRFIAPRQLSYFLLNNKKMERAPLSTDGIDINSWEIPFSDVEPELGEKYMKDNWSNKPISFSVWDFAGQEVYYSTHQFYLSRRSMYLVAFNLMDDTILKGTYGAMIHAASAHACMCVRVRSQRRA
jgi:GTPase SAR1 family protein